MCTRWPRPSFYLLAIFIIVLDQLAKRWAFASLRPLGSVTIWPGIFNLTYVQNTGIAFGMFAGKGVLVAVIVVALTLFALFFTRGLNWAGSEPNLVGGCLCGGALGNLLDRFRNGYVVDFFDLHFGSYHWPVFNVADSVICLSVGWIVLRQLTATSPTR